MKINKLVLIFLLSFSSIFYSNSTYSANTSTPVDYSQYKLDALPSPIDAKGTISINDAMKSSAIVSNVKTQSLQEYMWPNLIEALDQGNFGSCVSYAFRATKNMLSLQNNNPNEDHSAGFIYGFRQGYNYTGEGMHPSLALECFRLWGTCLNKTFPDRGTFSELHAKITQPMIQEASNHKIDEYVRLIDNEQIKTALVNISPVCLTIPIYNHFGDIMLESPDTSKENLYGYHEVVAVGFKYFDFGSGLKLYFRVLNSWGTGFGEKGYYWQSFDYPTVEAWAIIDSDELLNIQPSDITTTFSADITNLTVGDKFTYTTFANYPDNATRDITSEVNITYFDYLSQDKTTNTFTALKSGTTNITVSYKGISKDYTINISPKPTPPTPDPLTKIKRLNIISDNNSTKIFAGSDLKLSAIADKNSKTELNITDKVEWRLSDSSIATIDSSSNLSAIKEGKIKIIATYQYQYNNKSYTKSDYINIYVIPKTQYYTVNVLSTKDKMIADNMVEELNNKDLGFDAFIMQSGKYFKVYVGKFADNGGDEIKGLYKSLKGLEYKSSKIVYISGR